MNNAGQILLVVLYSDATFSLPASYKPSTDISLEMKSLDVVCIASQGELKIIREMKVPLCRITIFSKRDTTDEKSNSDQGAIA